MEILLNSLVINECEKAFNSLKYNPVINARSLQLSYKQDDTLDNSVSVYKYLVEYFSGDIIPLRNLEANLIINSELERLDLLYRSGSNQLTEFFSELDVGIFIHSRRAFSIAIKLNLEKIIDLYWEIDGRKWVNEFYSISSQLSPSPSTVSLSVDLSAKAKNGNFYLHAGTNNWNRVWLPYISDDERWNKQLSVWRNQLVEAEKIMISLKKIDYLILIVPEKDTLARITSEDFIESSPLPYIYVEEVARLIDKNRFLFPVYELLDKNIEYKYDEPESHLPPILYWNIFILILKKWGLNHLIDGVNPKLIKKEIYGDLESKFTNLNVGMKTASSIQFNIDSSRTISSGSSEFQNPLKNSFVSFSNDLAPIKHSVLILGDSHSSIGKLPFLTGIFSYFFSSVSFYWNPCYLNTQEFDKENYDFCLSEISQRFIMPNLDIKN